ncbi:MAG: hypothetical protein V3R32_01880 [Nitrosomonadaceae bacterium]
MKNYATILIGITAIIGLIGLSTTPAFANFTYDTKDILQVTIEALESNIVIRTPESSPQAEQVYVINYIKADSRIELARNLIEQWEVLKQGIRVNQ